MKEPLRLAKSLTKLKITLTIVGIKNIITPAKTLNRRILPAFFISSSFAPMTALKKSTLPKIMIIIGIIILKIKTILPINSRGAFNLVQYPTSSLEALLVPLFEPPAEDDSYVEL